MIVEVSWQISESIPTVLGQPHSGLIYYEVDAMPAKATVVAHLQRFIRHLDPFSVRIDKSDLTADDLMSRAMAFYRNALEPPQR
ncbi:MAG: hypothetical protein ACXWXZ_10030 [Candidatus Binatia bacterium]